MILPTVGTGKSTIQHGLKSPQGVFILTRLFIYLEILSQWKKGY